MWEVKQNYCFSMLNTVSNCFHIFILASGKFMARAEGKVGNVLIFTIMFVCYTGAAKKIVLQFCILYHVSTKNNMYERKILRRRSHDLRHKHLD